MAKLYIDEGAPSLGRKIMLATTVYGDCDASYTFSIQSSRQALHEAGFQTAYYLLQGNCHVDDARNDIACKFLASDCDALVFLDADVSWGAEDLVRLCKHDRDLVGGIYPYRSELGQEKVPVRVKHGEMVDDDGLLEVEGLPTGFMKISRHCMETVAKDCQTFVHENEERKLIFQRTLMHGTRWGGDLHFCNLWRATGGKLYADYEMVLGHASRSVISGSLASHVRKSTGRTLRHVCDKIKAGTWTMRDLTEAKRYADNFWGAQEDVLAAAVCLAKEANGPIIETGSGLTSIVMAAATSQTVYCLEHDPYYASRLIKMATEAGVEVGLCRVPLVGEWYDLSEFKGLPERFALGLNDGPPRYLGGNRKLFFSKMKCDVIISDDADDRDYAAFLREWAEDNDMQCDIGGRLAVLR
jgi:hypothetical protein